MENWTQHKIDNYAKKAHEIMTDSGYDRNDTKLLYTLIRAMAEQMTDDSTVKEVKTRINDIRWGESLKEEK